MANTITDYTHISTKHGDRGTSRNYSNDTLPKTDLLFETLGSIDELSCQLGLAFHHSDYKEPIPVIQLDLQHMMSLIATRIDDPRYGRLVPITTDDIERLEQWEQDILQECTIEPRFVLPGSESTLAGAHLDICRSLARRCERIILRYKEFYEREDLQPVATYMNRLSDLLFIMARSTDPK
jgi:cob(I)alamin adenosyltransferase